MTLLDRLVNVKISISSAVPDSTSFNYLLIVGASPLQAPSEAPPDVGVYYSFDDVTNAGWKLSDDNVAKAAYVAFANCADKIFIAVRKTVSDTPESIDTTLTRALSVDGWYGIALVDEKEGDISAASAWTETQEKIFCFSTTETTNPAGIQNMRSVGIYTDSNGYNPFIHVAALAKCLGYDAGSETWAYKTLAQITPVSLSNTQIDTLDGQNLNYYLACAGRNILLTGKVCGGEWIDTIRFRDWLHNDMQKRIYNLLCTNSKVPYTNAGISLIENQMISSLKQGQIQGGIANTEYDTDGNEVPGYTVTVPNAVDVPDADKATRTLNNCKFTARLAGAIHLVKITGVLTT